MNDPAKRPARGAHDPGSAGPARLRVVLATAVRLYRDGLVLALAGHPTLDVVAVGGELGAGHDGDLDALVRHRPHVVLADAALLRDSAVAARLAGAWPDAKLVAFGVAECDDDVLTCLRGGVCGCVARDASLDELVRAVEGAARGEPPCSPSIAAIAFREIARATKPDAAPAPERASAAGLTARERDIGALLDGGLPNKQIARRLGIEVPTVKNHVHHILQKLRVGSRREAGALLRHSARESP